MCSGSRSGVDIIPVTRLLEALRIKNVIENTGRMLLLAYPSKGCECLLRNMPELSDGGPVEAIGKPNSNGASSAIGHDRVRLCREISGDHARQQIHYHRCRLLYSLLIWKGCRRLPGKISRSSTYGSCQAIRLAAIRVY